MPIDTYAPCPCGSGKKLKFCCSDLKGEMEKIARMLEGEQRAGCLAHVATLLKKQPERASLLGLAAMLQQQLGQHEEAQQTLDLFLEKHPKNVIALAEQAMLHAATGRAKEAVDPLQGAIEGVAEEMPLRVYEAIGAVGQGLLAEGDLVAARAHLLLQAGIAGDDDPRAAQLLMRINAADEVPLILKDDWQLAEAPEGAAWNADFDAAFKNAYRGAWRKARQAFETLLDPSGQAAEVWWNLALLRGWLADAPGCLDALRTYATLRVPLDNAVEAEALAQMLDPDATGERIDTVLQVLPVEDIDATELKLVGDVRLSQVDMDPRQYADADGPPPRSLFWLLDRAMPESGAELGLDDIPHVVGRVFLFGCETDQPARLELVAGRGEPLSTCRTMLEEILGALSEPTEEEVVGATSQMSIAMSWSWRLPDDTPLEHRRELLDARRKRLLLEEWPRMSLPVLGGKTPLDAAADPQGRIQVQAAILLLELASASRDEPFDYNELRAQLDLNGGESIDPATLDGHHIPLARLHRVEAEKLSDDDLVNAYRRAMVFGANSAIESLAGEVVGRESLDDKVDQAEAYGALAESQIDRDQALDYVAKAKQAARDAGQSCAQWDLMEMAIQIDRGAVDAANSILAHVRETHMREPGVSEQLFRLMVSAGVLNPDGSPAGPPPQEESQLVVPTAAGGEPGEIWTPDAETSGQSSSKLWTPD
jgi:tetratricopeptide (TPR) repeat protein